MNPVLLAALGITGVSAAVAARRILQEKRRRHRQFQRQGGRILGPAEGAPEKGGLTAGEIEAQREELLERAAHSTGGDGGVQPIDYLQAGGNLDDLNRAIYGGDPDSMDGLYGIGNYEFVRARRF